VCLFADNSEKLSPLIVWQVRIVQDPARAFDAGDRKKRQKELRNKLGMIKKKIKLEKT